MTKGTHYVSNDPQVASTSADISKLSHNSTKGHHRRTSSLWVPPSRPVFSSPKQIILEKAETGTRILKQLPVAKWLWNAGPTLPQYRFISPNNEAYQDYQRWNHPNRRYLDNRVTTTKYNVLTFLPKNLLEQLHRAANLYFIFIVILNMIIGAFGKYVSLMPISFVLGVTAIKDAFEDYRRYKADQKINHSTCRVWDATQRRYRKLEWQNVIVGDFVHLSHDEVIPADILLLRSSDENGICYVDTCNLDGESNLKQRQAIRAMGKFHSSPGQIDFFPEEFKYRVVCEQPTTDVYKFDGRLETMDGGPSLPREYMLLAKENVLLRGCVVKNTDFVEGIVLYAGHDTKAMLNNSGPRYKRSTLEKLTNLDIIWCVVILLVLCLTGSILSGVFMDSFDNPYDVPFFTFTKARDNLRVGWEAFKNFWYFIIVLQVLIPISLYVSIEFIKIGQIWFMSQDMNMYYEKLDKRLHCRALNIPEELGQIQYVMSDKTGTLTENQMVFRRCSVNGRDFGGSISPIETVQGLKPQKDLVLDTVLTSVLHEPSMDNPMFAFFVTMAICNTVVVNAKPHEDLMDEEGEMMESRYECDGTPIEKPSTKPSVTFMEEERKKSPIQNSESSKNEIELIQFGEDKSNNASPISIAAESDQSLEEEKTIPKEDSKEKKDSKENMKIFTGILSHRNSLLSLAKGIKDLSPFRRSIDKRQSQSGDSIPPPHSFYDSESPDELALVEAAREYGIRLLRRRFNEVVVYIKSKGLSVRFEVLHTLPFDSDRKRMSVVVRECTDQKRVILLTKGADATMLPIIDKEFSESDDGENTVFMAQKHLSQYAKEGLRTLCLGRKFWSENDYETWKNTHEEAELDAHHKENLVQDSIHQAEKNIELLGVTAIEDRLQDGVPECIQSLRKAGVKVWVLTGDKIETAVNIAYSSKLFSQEMDLLNIGANSIRAVSDVLDEHLKRISHAAEVTEEAAFGLVLNGAYMDFCLDPHNEARFINVLKGCRSVLCCRATPLQKATLVRLAKTKLKSKVLAIGDGANDVSMIQGADVGVGLSGQEGMQAVMASDFSMARFRFLSQLLLVHGHWCYHRLAQTILYFFYKNALFVFAIFWYQIFCGFSSQVPIDPLYLMVYNLIFTSVPPLIYGWLEQDTSAEVLMDVPSLYDQGASGKKYKWYSFWLNMIDCVWQSAVIYWISHFTYNGFDCDMWTFGLTMCAQLLFVNTFHLALLVQYWTWPMFLSLLLSIVAFFLSSLLYNGFTNAYWTWTNVKDPPVMIAQFAMINPQFWLVCLLSTILCLLPRFLITVAVNTMRPSRVLSHRQYGAMKPKMTFLQCLRVLCCGRSQQRCTCATLAAEAVPSQKRGLVTSAAKGDGSQPIPQTATSVVATCAGFPKDMVKGPSTVLNSGVYGDDACFISRFKNTFVVGVADGVGGWRKYGIDPSVFSRKLMKECEKRVTTGEFDPRMPEDLLAKAFKATAEAPRPVGSSTACVLVVHQEKLYSANLGDSGFMIVRDGKVLTKSKEQVHYFNAPFQLTLPPEGIRGFIGDTPDLAEKEEVEIQKGDIILVATDGLWDNLSDKHVLEQLEPLVREEATVQETCNALALTARRLAFDTTHNSPFAEKAREHGYLAPGGKPDDITLVLILIV